MSCVSRGQLSPRSEIEIKLSRCVWLLFDDGPARSKSLSVVSNDELLFFRISCND